MPSPAAADYMTNTIMPSNRDRGCKCSYTHQEYLDGKWSHQKGCPSPYIEALPNAGRLMNALRAGGGHR